MRQVTPEVFEATGDLVRVGDDDIAFLKDRVGATARKRIRLCAHKGVDDDLHEMLIVLDRDTYIRPHKHLDKAESLHIIEGAADVVFFDDAGEIVDVTPLGEYGSGRRFFYRLGGPTFHTLVPRSELLVFHETIRGPFRRSDNVLASWSADEGDAAAAAAYRSRLVAAVDAFVRSRDRAERGRQRT